MHTCMHKGSICLSMKFNDGQSKMKINGIDHDLRCIKYLKPKNYLFWSFLLMHEAGKK